MIRSTDCPKPELIARLLDGDVTAEERDSLEGHVASCEPCYRLVTESEEVRSRLHREGEEPGGEKEPD